MPGLPRALLASVCTRSRWFIGELDAVQRARSRLTRHTVCRTEVLPRVCNDLTVRRMIDGFNADDLRSEISGVFLNKRDERDLRLSGADYQNLAGVGDVVGDIAEEMVLKTVESRFTSMLGMSDVVLQREDAILFHVFWRELEDLRFALVEPNNGMRIVHAVDRARPVPG